MDLRDINKLHAFNHYKIAIMDLEFQNRYHDRELKKSFNPDLDIGFFVICLDEMTNNPNIRGKINTLSHWASLEKTIT